MQLKNQGNRHHKKLEIHVFESPESQNQRRQDIIKWKSLTIANETEDQRNEQPKTHSETQQLVRANVEKFDRDIYVFAEKICKVFSKLCYPNQCANLTYQIMDFRAT
jgi:hypothetical protein